MCLHDRHGKRQATSSDLDNTLAGTLGVSKMAPVVDSSVLRKQMGFIWLMACVVAIRRREKRRMEESSRRMGRPWVRPWIERRAGQK